MFARMYRARVVRKVRFLPFIRVIYLIKIFRCMAQAKNLDGDAPLPRCREHSNVLVETLELGVLWDEYSLVGDIVVRTLLIYPLYWSILTS
jgi:hypothetical protein